MKVQREEIRMKNEHLVRKYETSGQIDTGEKIEIGKPGSIKRKKVEWAIGLIEAEGCIVFKEKSGKGTEKEKWLLTLEVAMPKRNYRAIYQLKKVLGYGKLHEDKSGRLVYKITDASILRKAIVPLLDQCPPRGVKYYEYEIWKKGLRVMEDTTISSMEKERKMRELKEESQKVREVSPVVSPKREDQMKEAKEVIERISVEHLRAIYTPSWVAGFIEGEGSFKINSRLQIEFEVGQKQEKMAVYALHKIWGIPGKVKVRASDGYTTLRTKHPEAISKIIATLKGEMRGMKSFEYKVWCSANHTTQDEKKSRAKELIEKIRRREEKTRKEEGGSAAKNTEVRQKS